MPLGRSRKERKSGCIIADDNIIFTDSATAQAIAETCRDDDWNNPEFKYEDLY